MKIVSFKDITQLGISPATCLDWIKESFSIKADSELPPKISVHPNGIDFYTSMPCLLPPSYDRYCVRVVHRINGAVPALGSDLLIYEVSTGNLLALMDCDWITAMRTGAVATYATQLFRKSEDVTYGIIGLGNTARATLLCLLDSEPGIQHHVILHAYKDYAPLFIQRFSSYDNVVFETRETVAEVVRNSDVLLRCVTQAEGLLCEDISCFRPGCLVVPVHTRGFQNCDTVFDKVYADDTGHVKGFKYFDSFRSFAELQDVVNGLAPGRESPDERILSYNVGIALHDALFASKIWNLLGGDASLQAPDYQKQTDKFWV